MSEYKSSEAQRRASAKYRRDHREKCNELNRIYARKNPELGRARVEKFRARQKIIKECFLEYAMIDISCV
jgi:hypothetical protein